LERCFYVSSIVPFKIKIVYLLANATALWEWHCCPTIRIR